MEAVRAGCHGLHLTINGMGERAGNTPMASTVASLKDFLPDIKININESSTVVSWLQLLLVRNSCKQTSSWPECFYPNCRNTRRW